MTLLKNSEFIIGNSSAGVYEAPIFGIPTINIGNRQHKRLNTKIIKNLEINNIKSKNIKHFLNNYRSIKKKYYGTGKSDKKFSQILQQSSFWKTSKQKYFSDLKRKYKKTK